MLGTEPSQTQPTIVFASLSERQRKRAKSLVKEQNLLANHPSIKMKTIPRLPALPRGAPKAFESPTLSEPCSTSGICERPSGAEGISKQTTQNLLTFDGGGIRGYASLLILKELMRHIGKVEELLHNPQDEETWPVAGHKCREGGFLQIRNETYHLSALHPYLDLDVEDDGQESRESRDSDFDSDSDDECGDYKNRQHSSSSRSELHTLDASNEVAAAANIPHVGLDYRVIHVHDTNHALRNIIKLDGESPRSITPRVVASKAEERNVVVNTQTTGPVQGRLMRAPRYIKMAGWSTFQEMWVVKMSRDAVPGDCGAWVVEDSDDNNTKLFGHVVAGQPGSFEAYIIPACQIFDDIEKQFGVKPEFPESRNSPAEGRLSSANLFSSFYPQDNPKKPDFLPCHYFNYIGGTSTGGLIALMLGRWQMSVSDVLTKYETLAGQVFGKRRLLSMRGPIPWFKPKYSTTMLEEAFRGGIQGSRQNDPDGQTFSRGSEFFSPSDGCRTIVCTFGENLTTGIRQPLLFRNYSHRLSIRRRSRTSSHSLSTPDSELSQLSGTTSDLWSKFSKSSNSSWDGGVNIPPKLSPPIQRADSMAIWKVARATSAAPTYFDSIKIDGVMHLDGGFGGHNNPTKLAYDEIRSTSSLPPFIVSIGTGMDNKVNYHSRKSLFRKIKTYLNPSDELSRDSELVHWEMKKLSSAAKFSYFRFNVDSGIGDIKLDEWKSSTSRRLGTLDHIRQATEKYLQQDVVQEELAKLAQALVQQRQQRLDSGEDHWARYMNELPRKRNEIQARQTRELCGHEPTGKRKNS
jgi:hypothetical protein